MLAAIGYGVWTWSDFRWQRRLQDREGQLQTEIATERQNAAEMVAQRRAKEGEVVGRPMTHWLFTKNQVGCKPTTDTYWPIVA